MDLIKLYKASDIFIFPSLIESFGIVIIEAMAAGVPPIVSEFPGSKDLVKNNQNGFVVSKNNARQFVNVIVNFYNNKDLLIELKRIVSVQSKNMIGKRSPLNISVYIIRLSKKHSNN